MNRPRVDAAKAVMFDALLVDSVAELRRVVRLRNLEPDLPD
jgi:hypothetical protein